MSAPRLGAVAYLNMLPHFFDDAEIELYATPTALNQALARGEIDAGCSSLVAGLDLRLRPLKPLLGVAAAQRVRSVFVEPVFVEMADKTRWQELLHHVSAMSDIPTGELIHPEVAGENLVTVHTSGASAQSLWLLESMLCSAGMRSQVRSIDFAAELEPTKALRDQFRSYNVENEGLHCLLVIGDRALKRNALHDLSEVDLRVDVAQLWRSFSGLPCVFALWFGHSRLSEGALEEIQGRVAERLERWRAASPQQRWSAVVDFLDCSGQSDLVAVLGKAAILDYLGTLQYDLGSMGYAQSLQIMQHLHEVTRLPQAPPSSVQHEAERVAL